MSNLCISRWKSFPSEELIRFSLRQWMRKLLISRWDSFISGMKEATYQEMRNNRTAFDQKIASYEKMEKYLIRRGESFFSDDEIACHQRMREKAVHQLMRSLLTRKWTSFSSEDRKTSHQQMNKFLIRWQDIWKWERFELEQGSFSSEDKKKIQYKMRNIPLIRRWKLQKELEEGSQKQLLHKSQQDLL